MLDPSEWGPTSCIMRPPLARTCFSTSSNPFSSLGKWDSKGWCSLCPLGSYFLFVISFFSFVKRWKGTWFWVRLQWQKYEGDMVTFMTVSTTYSKTHVCPIFTFSCLVIVLISTFNVLQGRLIVSRWPRQSWAFVENIYLCFPSFQKIEWLIVACQFFEEFGLMSWSDKISRFSYWIQVIIHDDDVFPLQKTL